LPASVLELLRQSPEWDSRVGKKEEKLIVPVTPKPSTEHRFKGLERKIVPLELCASATAHSLQGATCHSGVSVTCGPAEPCLGFSLVTLSRTDDVDELILMDDDLRPGRFTREMAGDRHMQRAQQGRVRHASILQSRDILQNKDLAEALGLTRSAGLADARKSLLEFMQERDGKLAEWEQRTRDFEQNVLRGVPYLEWCALYPDNQDCLPEHDGAKVGWCQCECCQRSILGARGARGGGDDREVRLLLCSIFCM
jgi:hypothetical protein